MSEYCAYDYEKQEWLDGEAARQMLLLQLKAELDLLHSSHGAEYWASMQKGSTLHDDEHASMTKYMAHLESELERINNDPNPDQN